MLLTFEFDRQNETLEVHADTEGLDKFIRRLSRLRERELSEGDKVYETLDHAHFFSPAWGGDELTEERKTPGSELINHVEVYQWQD